MMENKNNEIIDTCIKEFGFIFKKDILWKLDETTLILMLEQVMDSAQQELLDEVEQFRFFCYSILRNCKRISGTLQKDQNQTWIKMRIPKQLQDTEFRFYLVGKNSKLPVEPRWNTTNNYLYTAERLLRHRGNYGVVGGFGQLIILDFDNRDFYNDAVNELPPTFTVLSAGKRLPHMYYRLVGTMIRRRAIRDKNNDTLLDIQAERAGVVGPNSKIGKRYYDVANHEQIAYIHVDRLEELFRFKSEYKRQFKGEIKPKPIKVRETMAVLNSLNIKQTSDHLFECPFHTMHGKGNLSVMDTGRIYCFHEMKCWHSAYQFAIDFATFKGDSKLKQKMEGLLQ